MGQEMKYEVHEILEVVEDDLSKYREGRRWIFDYHDDDQITCIEFYDGFIWRGDWNLRPQNINSFLFDKKHYPQFEVVSHGIKQE